MPEYHHSSHPAFIKAEYLWDTPVEAGALERKLRPAGRVCAYEHCSTILSRWNRGTLCGPCEKEANARRIEAERQAAAEELALRDNQHHGSHRGYAGHKRRGERACLACYEAEAAYSRERRNAK